MPTLVSHPDEVRVISRRFGQGAEQIDKYLETDGYAAARMAIEHGSDWIINEMKASGLLPHWIEMVLRSQAESETKICARQW